MKAFLVNYNYTPTWLNDYAFDWTICDRSVDNSYLEGFDQAHIIKTENVGNVDYDKLSYLVDNYETLPDVFLWGKTNLFKYISEEEFKPLKDLTEFTPLLTQHHPVREGISFYRDKMYHEYANVHAYQSWDSLRTWHEWANFFHLPKVDAIPFAPGGNYILTKERVQRYPKVLYEVMRSTLPYTQLPGEAHLAERSYYLLWN